MSIYHLNLFVSFLFFGGVCVCVFLFVRFLNFVCFLYSYSKGNGEDDDVCFHVLFLVLV